MHLLLSTLHVYSILLDAVSDYQDTCHASARTDARYGTVMACRVCLTVSSLLPTGNLVSDGTNWLCFQLAYFPVLHRLRKSLCVTRVLTESRARVRESVYIICTSMEIQHAR
jgi:hypothetical protein